MKKFHKRRGVIITQLSAYEVELLASLIMQLVELLSDGEPAGFATQSEPSDAFDEIVKNLEGEPDEPGPLEDPVLKRLFPDAYPNDSAASADFRRFTERDMKAIQSHRSTSRPRPSCSQPSSGLAISRSQLRRSRAGCEP
jgi:hypothetical protein